MFASQPFTAGARKLSSEWLPDFVQNDGPLDGNLDGNAWASSDLLSTPGIKVEGGISTYFENNGEDGNLLAYQYAEPSVTFPNFSVLPSNDMLRTLPSAPDADTENVDLHSDPAYLAAFAFTIAPSTAVGVVPHSPFSSLSPSPEATAFTSPTDSLSEEDGGHSRSDHPSFGDDDDDDDDSSSDRGNGEGGTTFKQRHNASERKRQATINEAISTLRQMLPVKLPNNKRVPKGTILQKVVDYMRYLVKSNTRLKAEVEQQRQEISLLNQRLSSLHSGKPSTSATASYARGVTVMMGVMTFMFAMSATTTIYSQSVDNTATAMDAPLGRALQAISGVDFTSDSSVVFVWIISFVSAIAGFVRAVWFALMNLVLLLSIGTLFNLASVFMLPEDSADLEQVSKLTAMAERAFASGSIANVERYKDEAIEIVGYSDIMVSTNRLWLFWVVATNAVMHMITQIPATRYIVRRVVRFRKGMRYYDQVARIMYYSLIEGMMRDAPANPKANNLRQMAMLLISMNACEFGNNNDALYSMCLSTMAKGVGHIRIPCGSTIVKAWSEKLHNYSVWRSVRSGTFGDRTSLARFFSMRAIRAFADGQLRDSVTMLSQAADFHMAGGLYAIWRINTLMIASMYLITGELLSEAGRLIKIAAEHPYQKENRSRMAIDLFSLIHRYKTMSVTSANLTELLEQINQLDWPQAEQRNLHNILQSFKALVLVRLERYTETNAILVEVPREPDSFANIDSFRILTLDIAAEASLRLLQAVISKQPGTESISLADLEPHVLQWLNAVVDYTKYIKIARPMALRMFGHYHSMKADPARGRQLLSRSIAAAEALGWSELPRQLRSEMRLLEEHCTKSGLFLGDPQNLSV